MMFTGDQGPPTFSEQVIAMMDPRREKLLKAKLGALWTWSRPEIVETVGPYNLEMHNAYAVFREAMIKECAEKLLSYDDHQISVLLGEVEDDTDDLLDDWRRFREDKIRNGVRHMPPWHASGFGHPDHAADFEHWSKMAIFTIHELLCLSVGVEPGSLDSSELAKLAAAPRERHGDYWPTLNFLIRRREQLVRQFCFRSTDCRVTPKSFLAWVDKVAFDAHPELLRLLRRYHVEEAREPAASAAPPRQDPREVDTIAQLFTAMAIDHLGYDPQQDRSPILKEITDLAASMGMQVSTETVRKYLRRGAAFIPEDWSPNRPIR
ncbi:MAG: hypothetical protein ACE37J_16350 [Pikeienuella sp.]|uniref:hypothetical protein n=1 Tax=Pikeienuella sp. TaxID=2831957 RepID=UPI003918A015